MKVNYKKLWKLLIDKAPGFRPKGSKIDGQVTQIFTLLSIIYLLSTKSLQYKEVSVNF